jgi:pSer/pThr/pTyr-binding forkhead associated (FHA) protein
MTYRQEAAAMADGSETVHGPGRMWLVVFSEGKAQRFAEVTGPRFTVGREKGCDLVLDDERVSRQHAYLAPAPGPGRLLYDLDSANGTLVDGNPVSVPLGFGNEAARVAEVNGGEWLQFGDTAVLATRQDPRITAAEQGVELGESPGGEPTEGKG